MEHRSITPEDAAKLVSREESHFWDHKSARSSGSVIQKIAAALGNADGGEFIVGIEDRSTGVGLTRWQGFNSIEDATPVLDALARDVKPPVPYTIEFLSIDRMPTAGIAALVQIRKSESVHHASDGKVYVRRSASTTSISGQAVADLALSKGARSYEDQLLADYDADDLKSEEELGQFLASYSPTTSPVDFIRKQRLINRETRAAKFGSAILYAENPAAVVPKRCSVKIARYNTKSANPQRESLVATPLTIEGPARILIDETIRQVTAMIEAVSFLRPDGTMAPMSYPPEVLKEIIVNAVIHRDYNISDDIRVSVLNNRVEVRSPGTLPGQMTLDNLTEERFSRNPTIVRLLNKYPDPPNKDIGEGLRTVHDKMLEAKLRPPVFSIEGGYFVVVLGHTPLARPQEIILEYLESNEEVTNSVARSLTGITSENAMKDVFYTLRDAGKLERVPEKHGNKSAWRRTNTEIERTRQVEETPTIISKPTGVVPARDASSQSLRPSTQKRRFTDRTGRAPGRNQPCSCGSGLKFKHCHGKASN